MSTEPFNVLVSSAGRRVALLRSFRESLRELGLAGEVIATDQSLLSSAFHSADHAVRVPHCERDEYVPALLELCRDRSVRLVIPTIDTELPVLAANRQQFAVHGITVAVSDPETVAISTDKRQTHAWLVAHGFPTVRQATVDEVLDDPDGWPFPLVVKPRQGSASIGVTTVGSLGELETATASGDVVVQTRAPGDEYTVDVLVSRDGRVACVVPRRRLEVRSGEVSKSVTVRCAVLEDLARRLCESLPGPYGALNVQVFHDPAGPHTSVIEINPRFGGGFPLSQAAGAYFPRWLIEEVAGLPGTTPRTWQAGVVMLRYDDAVFVDAGDVDLDVACEEPRRS